MTYIRTGFCHDIQKVKFSNYNISLISLLDRPIHLENMPKHVANMKSVSETAYTLYTDHRRYPH